MADGTDIPDNMSKYNLFFYLCFTFILFKISYQAKSATFRVCEVFDLILEIYDIWPHRH
jgi:hypothetical protein